MWFTKQKQLNLQRKSVKLNRFRATDKAEGGTKGCEWVSDESYVDAILNLRGLIPGSLETSSAGRNWFHVSYDDALAVPYGYSPSV